MSLFDTQFDERVTPAAERAFGVTVLYVRGKDQFEVTAFSTEVVEQLMDRNGVYVESKTRMFEIRTDAKPFVEGPEKPIRGDQIIQEFKGVSRVFEVLPGMKGKNWQWSADRNYFEINTVERE